DRSLFAAKGRASAAGARPQSGAGDDPAEAAAAQPALVQTDGGAGTRAAVDQQPGSLLAFRLRSAPGKSALTGDMMTALSRPAGAKAPAEAVPATNAAHAAPPAVEIPPAAAVEITPAAADAAPAPATEAPAPAPAVSESPGGRIDQPAFPQSLPRRRDIIGERGAARPPAAPPAVIAIPPRPSTLRTVLPAAAAVAAIAVVGWLIAQSDPAAPEAPAA